MDAQWQLALTRLALAQGLFGAFTVGDIRREFERVIKLDPNHPEAYYMLGTTYYDYGKLDDAAAAIPLFEQQLAANPRHEDARYQLGLAYIDVERVIDGIAALERIQRVNPSWVVRINQTIAEAKLRHSIVRADSIQSVLTLLPEAEHRLYLDLRPVLPPGQGAFPENLSLADAETMAFRYWQEHDPTPGTPQNERFVEHCRRVAYARRYFGRGQWPWDRRGEVYIRYGEPSARRVYTADYTIRPPSDPTSAGATPQLGIRQVEEWTYTTPPLRFEFIDQGSNFVFDLSLPVASGDVAVQAEQALRDQGAEAEQMAARTPAFYPADERHGPPLRFSYSLAVFRGVNGQSEVEVDYAIPANELAFIEERASLETAVVVYDEGWREVTKSVEQTQVADQTRGAGRAAQVAIYRRTLAVPPGQRHVALHVTDLHSRRDGISRQPLMIEGYEPGRFAMSDIRLVTTVQPMTSGTFVRGGRRLIPNPTGVFLTTRPMTLYFEVYNLLKDRNGRTSVTIEYTVFPLSGSSRPAIALVSPAGGQTGKGREFSLIQEEEGTEDTLRRDTAIEMKDAPPGRYALQVTVTDHNRDEETQKTVVFQLVR
ncbi:MAG: GWxTD domain-containing protein [Candidatus Latescibacteria bacterium]|nr:GWxTD domain-containing protein [Candidatus Latescibacterota bacterium]